MNRLQSLKAMLCFVTILCTLTSFAKVNYNINTGPDTVLLDVNTSEQRLVGQCLMLLSARYNVDIAKSEVTQARAWYNPNIVYTQSLYDPSSGSWLDNNPSSGQVDVQVNQLLSIAGRHINAVRLAEIDVKRNQLSFDDLSLALKFEMYSDLADLYEAQQTDQVYTSEVSALDNVIEAAQQQLKLGASAGNDVIRLKAERQSTITDKLENLNFIEELEARLRILLGFRQNSWLKIVKIPMPDGKVPVLDSLIQIASKRPDVQLASTNVRWNQQNLKLQKSQGVPDLIVGTEYDRRSSYVNNLWTVNAGIDIPIFNRNQGNIRAARFALEQSQYDDTLQQLNAQSEVVSAYGQFLRIRQVRDSVNSQPGVISGDGLNKKGSYSEDIDMLFTNIIENYSHRRISLIEFLDQLRTYEDARRGIITLDSDYFRAAQQLNYVTGSQIIR
ncbi:MAG TPA: TolC family protein [Bacteroidia bacterium]|nr:TolC family protein [Bacteroidia bacterium]